MIKQLLNFSSIFPTRAKKYHIIQFPDGKGFLCKRLFAKLNAAFPLISAGPQISATHLVIYVEIKPPSNLYMRRSLKYLLYSTSS